MTQNKEHEYCEYCKKNPITLIGHVMLHDGVNIKNGFLVHWHPGKHPDLKKINFCPMCGRKIQ